MGIPCRGCMVCRSSTEALPVLQCYTVVMKQSTAQCITDTVRFQHHNVKLPKVTPAEHIEKAVRELTNSVKANPTEGPANYIEAVQCLRAVVLGEKPPCVQEGKIPQCNPSQAAEQPAILKAIPKTAQNPPERLAVVAMQPVMSKDKPNNTPPRWSPALITCDDNEVELTQQDHDLVTPCPAS
eukprot:3556966-Ditylum_brightwellii.AAC.1